MAKDVEWIELAPYARKHAIPVRTLRRRLTALHAQRGNVLKSVNAPGTRVRRWWFDASALGASVPVPTEPPHSVAELQQRLDRIEARLTKLRNEDARLKRRVNKI